MRFKQSFLSLRARDLFHEAVPRKVVMRQREWKLQQRRRRCLGGMLRQISNRIVHRLRARESASFRGEHFSTLPSHNNIHLPCDLDDTQYSEKPPRLLSTSPIEQLDRQRLDSRSKSRAARHEDCHGYEYSWMRRRDGQGNDSVAGYF